MDFEQAFAGFALAVLLPLALLGVLWLIMNGYA